MSTKTTIKRVALVAVSALGFGLMSVVPSSATADNKISALVGATDAYTASVGSTISMPVRVTIDAEISDTLTLLASVTTNVSGNTATAQWSSTTGSTLAGTSVATTVTNGAATNADPTTIVSRTDVTGTITAGSGTTNVNAVAGTLTFTPGAAGTYTITVANDVNSNGSGLGDESDTITVYAYNLAQNGASVIGTVGDGGLPSNNAIVNGVAGPANTVTVRAFPSTTSGVRSLIVVSGASAYIAGEAGATLTEAAGTNPTTGTIASASQNGTHTDVVVATPAVGTATVQIFRETAASSGIFSATAAGTVTINVAATRSAGTVSVANSTVYASTTLGAVADAATDAAMTSVVGTGTPAVRVRYTVDVKDTLSNAMPASTTALTVSISGPGLISATNGGTNARVLAMNWPSAPDFFLSSDGTAGTSTITVSWGTTVLATKTVTFTGAARTISAGMLKPHITVGAVANAIWVLAVDANGNAVSYTPVGTSSDTTVVANNITNCATASAGERLLGAPLGSNVCDLTGVGAGAAKLTIAAGATTTNSPSVDLRVTKQVIAAIELKTDKASYVPGEKITLTLEAKDADGVLLGARDTDYDVLSAFSVNQSLTGTALGTAALAFNAGVVTTTYFAPLIPGTVTFEATLDAAAPLATALQGTKISRTITITGGAGVEAAEAATDAALEAIDAANAAVDAANQATEAADAATVAAEEARDAADAATAAVEALAADVAKMINEIKAQLKAMSKTIARIARAVR